ncbi:MAG: hypothetical protein NVSMB33_17030 [Ktedonobacteraceae bacterium]
MPDQKKRTQSRTTNPNVTSAVGLQETAGRLRARRSSLFTQTIIWITGLICLALLLASLAQAWSNSQLMQRVQTAQQQLEQTQQHHTALTKLAAHYQDPFVIENEARQQLGYIRPGEHPVVIIGANNQKQLTSSHTTPPPTEQGYWHEWWKAFFGN